jgi:hypothetical protein
MLNSFDFAETGTGYFDGVLMQIDGLFSVGAFDLPDDR